LKRAIIATQLVNRIVNLAGPLYIHRTREISNTPAWCAARSFVLADGAFGLSQLKARIAALDLKIPAPIQNRMLAEIAQVLRRLGFWFVVQLPAGAEIAATIATYAEGYAALKGRFSQFVSPIEARQVEERIAELTAAGVPQDVADEVGVLPLLGAAAEIVLLAQRHGLPVDAVAGAHFQMGALVGFDRMRALSAQVAAADHWDRLALRRIVDDLYAAQRTLTSESLAQAGESLAHRDRAKGAAAVRAWSIGRRDDIARTHAFLEELERGGPPTIAKLTLVNSQVQKIALPA
jgi:glutamate dehydrogenase